MLSIQLYKGNSTGKFGIFDCRIYMKKLYEMFHLIIIQIQSHFIGIMDVTKTQISQFRISFYEAMLPIQL